MYRLIFHSLPWTLWVIIIYAVVVYSLGLGFLDDHEIVIHNVGRGEIHLGGTALFIGLAFLAAAGEIYRATHPRDNVGNDTWSLIVMMGAVALLIIIDRFGTFAFLTIVAACVFDVWGDRVVGNAVARTTLGVSPQQPLGR